MAIMATINTSKYDCPLRVQQFSPAHSCVLDVENANVMQLMAVGKRGIGKVHVLPRPLRISAWNEF